MSELASVTEGSSEDRRYLRIACRLALKAAGRTSPNPMVGAMLVRNGQVVGSGFHKAADRKSTRLNSSHLVISYAVFCLKKKKNNQDMSRALRACCVSHR